MRRVPIVATLVVTAAVGTMVWLGIWQLHRAAWKERLLADYSAAASLPPVDLDPLLDGRVPPPLLAFRRALVTCDARNAAAEVRVGRNLHDEVGQAYLIPCRPGAAGLAGRIQVNVGWSANPSAPIRRSLQGLVAGRLGAVDESGPITLTAATAVPPLVPSQPVSVEAIPNNHLAYAFQWFAFAAIGLVTYVLALRRRNRDALPPEP